MELMTEFETELLPLVRKKLASYSGPIGASGGDFSVAVRSYFTSEPIVQRWLAECCPTGRHGYRLATGCDVLSAAALEVEYTQTEQARDLFARRLFVIAVDGSGYGYTLDLKNGKVYFLLGAWGGETGTIFEQAVQKEWPNLKSFVTELESRHGVLFFNSQNC